MDCAKTPKFHCRVADLDLPERRKGYASSRVEEEYGALKCTCGNADESRTYIVEYREIYKEERNVLQER